MQFGKDTFPLICDNSEKIGVELEDPYILLY
jgi:hypothetical protein